MSAPEAPNLLFFDTFSHDTSEELNLDLVQFPKSVYVREIRIIPLGARVEGDFPGGVRLGATNPTKFHIDFFVNDLSKPGACTFEALGSLDYCQNGQIHMECGANVEQPRIPTDGLVLRGWYTTITLAVYGNLTQVVPETPVGVSAPPTIQRPVVAREPLPVPTPVQPTPEWTPEPTAPIPSYTSNVATPNTEPYGPNNYPENYDTYRNDYYDAAAPKDPRTYHHMDDDWEKRDLSVEREGDRLRHSPRSIDHDRSKRETRSRRRSLDRRSRESSRLRDRSREDRIDRHHTRSRSRDREYIVKGEYRHSRSRSRSLDRLRGVSNDRDWDRGSYKKDDYRRRRDASYDRSRGASYDKDASYDRRSPLDKRSSYEKRPSPYEKRGSSYERRATSYDKQSPYDRKRHSPYTRIRGSSYSSRSPSRDDPRKRPRTPPGESSRRPISPREGEASSPINSIRSEETGEFDRSGKQIPRVDFYHQSYRHKNPIRSPSQEAEAATYVEPHTSLVTVPLVDNPAPKPAEPNTTQDEDKSMDAEPFEPILSDEEICDDLEGPSYIEDYDVNDYEGVYDIIKYYNPFKCEWTMYEHVNKIHLLGVTKDGPKNVLTATFDELCEASPDLLKLSELTKKTEPKLSENTFTEVDNSIREDWVHQCEQVFVSITNLCKNTDIILRIFPNDKCKNKCEEFTDIYNLLLTFCRIGLNYEFTLAQQQPTYKIRHMKCGIRLAEALTGHRHTEVVFKSLFDTGIDLPMQLLDIYSKEYMALSIRLMILQSINACLSSKFAVKQFMKPTIFPKFDKNETERKPKNGYQALISILQNNPLTRIKFSISALIKKLNMYELLEKLRGVVFKIYEKAGSIEKGEDKVSESDINFIVDALEEMLHMYRTHCFHISQPKRFLPVSAQFDINRDCSNEVLLEFFKIHQVLEVALFIMTCPVTSNNLVIVSPIHDLIYELIHSENGINFLYRNMEMSELLFKTLVQPYGQNPDEFIYPHDLTNYTELQILGLELAYRLRAIYHLQSICDLQAGSSVNENELIDRLQSLYCLSFGSIGKTAVPDVIVMGDNADCLMDVFESDLKNKAKTESPSKQKSPAKGYAIELIVSAIRFSAHVPFLKKYGQRLMTVTKEHDRFEPSVSSVLQEVIPYLKPIEKPSVLTGDDMAEVIEIIKASSEHSPDLPGELTTSVRILRHFCISDFEKNVTIANETAVEEYVDLKDKYNCFQLFSYDGVAHLAGILDKLATHFDQPSMHTSFFASTKGLQLAQLILPCLRLIDEMLARVVRSRGPRFRDMTAAPILLKTYGIAKTFPVGSVGYKTAAKAAEAAVRALLAYAQPIADDANDGDSIRRGPWTSLCSEVISYTMTAPYTFVPGLLVFSELLPLPLPMQTKTAPTERELADAANERRLWSAHLHALSNDLTDMIQIICMSTYRPVVHMLRRVCVQVADLAPNTAATVAKAAVGAVTRELKPGEPASASAARVLGFLACLVSHAPVKCAVLHAMSSGGPKADDLKNALCAVLSQASAASEHSAAQEFAAHALAALCDIEITLTPATATDILVANSLPNKEALTAFLDASADCLESTTKTCAVAQAVLRAYFVLTDHEYGFQHFRKFVNKKREALGKFLAWCAERSGEERAECLSLWVELARELAGEGEARRAALAPHDLADMMGYSDGDADHPVFRLEALMKERNSEEDAQAARFITSQLQKLSSTAPAGAESPEPAGAGSALSAQFLSRCVRAPPDADDRLTTSYWLNLPAPNDDDDVNDTELVSVDLVEVARLQLGAGGGEALCAAVRRLAGCLEQRPEPRPPDDKRPAVALSVVRGEGALDSFRSRPPNTSRPPSLHVDDFTALHHPHHPHHAPHRYRTHSLILLHTHTLDSFRSRPPNTSRPPSLHVDDFTALHHPHHPHHAPHRYRTHSLILLHTHTLDSFRSRPPNTSRPPSLHVDDFTALHHPHHPHHAPHRYRTHSLILLHTHTLDSFRSRPPNTSRPPSLHVDDFTALHHPHHPHHAPHRYRTHSLILLHTHTLDSFRSRPPNTSRPPSLHVDDFTALHHPHHPHHAPHRYRTHSLILLHTHTLDSFRSRPPNTSRPPSLHVDDFTALHHPHHPHHAPHRYRTHSLILLHTHTLDSFRSRPPNTSRPPSLHVDDFTALHHPHHPHHAPHRYRTHSLILLHTHTLDSFRSRPPNTSRPPSLHVDDFTALHHPHHPHHAPHRYRTHSLILLHTHTLDSFRSRPPNTSRPPSLHVDDFTALHHPHHPHHAPHRYRTHSLILLHTHTLDSFRSRPPNTSRPPSLHVDDFTALHHPHHPHHAPHRYRTHSLILLHTHTLDSFRSRPPNTSRPPSLHVDDFTALHHPHHPHHAPHRYRTHSLILLHTHTLDSFRSRPPNTSRPPSLHVDDFTALHHPHHPHHAPHRGMRRGLAVADRGRFASAAPMHTHYRHLRGRGAWEMGGSHFGHFPPSSQYMMGGMGWGGGRMQRGPRHRSFMR